MNEAGQATALAYPENTPARSYMWSRQDGFVDVGRPLGRTNIFATDISERGVICGYAAVGGPDAPFVWHKDTGWAVLDRLVGRNQDPWGVNSRLEVVGHSYFTAQDVRAFVWHPATGMRELSTLVRDLGGWQLISAAGVNDSGWVCGTGLHNGKHRGFVAIPESPVPCAMRVRGESLARHTRFRPVNRRECPAFEPHARSRHLRRLMLNSEAGNTHARPNADSL